jgi:hypothetical protein
MRDMEIPTLPICKTQWAAATRTPAKHKPIRIGPRNRGVPAEQSAERRRTSGIGRADHRAAPDAGLLGPISGKLAGYRAFRNTSYPANEPRLPIRFVKPTVHELSFTVSGDGRRRDRSNAQDQQKGRVHHGDETSDDFSRDRLRQGRRSTQRAY